MPLIGVFKNLFETINSKVLKIATPIEKNIDKGQLYGEGGRAGKKKTNRKDVYNTIDGDITFIEALGSS